MAARRDREIALDDDIRVLSGVRLFEGFTAEQLRLLAFGTERISLPASRRLYREEDEADSAYVVVRGSIEIFREAGGRVPVAHVGTGAILGEIALIADTRRMTSAEASVSTEVLRLNRKMFHRILEEYPDLAQLLYSRILQDFQSLVAEIESMASRFDD